MGVGQDDGRAAAGRGAWAGRFVDSDGQVEARTGRTVPEIWRADGEAAFRRLESRGAGRRPGLDRRPGSSPPPAAPCSTPSNRRLLRAAPTRSCGCGRRAGDARRPGRARATHRPLLDDDPAGALAPARRRAPAALRGGGRRRRRRRRPHRRPGRRRGASRLRPAERGGRRDHRPGRPAATGPTTCSSAPAPATGCSRCCPSACSGRRSSPRPAIGVAVDAGVEQRTFLIGDGEEAKCLETVEELCRGFARWGLTRARRRRGRRRRRGHRHRRLRRRRLPPGRGRRARGHHAARPGRRRHRRQDGRQPARGQEPGRRLLAAGGGAVRHRGARRPCRPGSTAAAWGRWPSTPSSASTTCPTCRSTRRWRPACGARPRSSAADERETHRPAGPAQLRPHPGPRPGDGRPLRPAPRRGGGHRPRLRRRAGPPPRPHRRRAGRPSTGRWSAATTCPTRPARRAPTPTSWSRSWAGTRRRSTGSPSCSTAPAASRWSTGVAGRPSSAALDEDAP